MEQATHFIKRKTATSMLHGVRTAAALGRPLNTFVTINFWQLGASPKEAYDSFRRLRDTHFQRWSLYKPKGARGPRNGPPTYIWAIEAPDQRPHLHWLLHIASGNRALFQAALNRWLMRIHRTDRVPARAVHICPAHNPEGLKLYLAKGIDPALGKLWNISPVQAGMVSKRRAGTSRNLGPAEWRTRKAGWLRHRRSNNPPKT